MEDCIVSLIDQSYKNIEIIIINDGSTDKSGEICNAFLLKDERIKVFHKKNEGVSSARNFGLKKATGQYIMFVDSDDYLDLRAVNLLVSVMNDRNPDLLIYGYVLDQNSKYTEISCKNAYLKNKEEICKYISENYLDGCINSPANKFYKKSLIHHFFDESYSLGEDLLFNLGYLNAVNSVLCLDERLYYYRVDGIGSLSHKFRKDLFTITTDLHANLMEFLNENSTQALNYNAIHLQLFRNTLTYLIGLVSSNDLKRKNKIKYINSLSDSEELIAAMDNMGNLSTSYALVRILIKNRMSYSLYTLINAWIHVKEKKIFL